MLLAWANRPTPPLPAGAKADRVVVDKSERRLDLVAGGEVIASYRVSLGAAPAGDKQREGDERTPEGTYTLDWRNPRSAFHLSLHVSYPEPAERADPPSESGEPVWRDFR